MGRMTTMRDPHARRIAVVALVVALFTAISAFMLGSASADPTTEPDAAALAQRIDILELENARMQYKIGVLVTSANDQAASISILADVVQPIDCLAFSSYHGFRETLGPKGRKYHTFPIMLWNVTAPGCKPSPVEFRKRIARVSRVLAAR